MATGHGVLWHISQVLPILTSAAWAIACIVTLFTTPTRSSLSSSSGSGSSSSSSSSPFSPGGGFSSGTSSSSSSSPFSPGGSFSNSSNNFEQTRNNMFFLWAGGAVGIVFTSLGVAMYLGLVCVDSVSRRGSNAAAWGKRRKGAVWVTVVVRSIGVVAGVAVGAYYATRKQSRLVAPIVLAFVFAVAGLVAIVVSLTKKPKQLVGDGQPAASSSLSEQNYYHSNQQQYGYQPQHGAGNGGVPYGQHQHSSSGAAADGHNPGFQNNGPSGWQGPPKA